MQSGRRRLPDETLDYVEVVRARHPEASFHIQRPGQGTVEPPPEALRGCDAWFTGLRRDQPGSRSAIKKVEIDHNHDGMVKVNPLAEWSQRNVDGYLAARGIPLHPLYAQGYASIGCAPCTRAIRPGEDERAGRWWWEAGADEECGIHYAPGGDRRASPLLRVPHGRDRVASLAPPPAATGRRP